MYTNTIFGLHVSYDMTYTLLLFVYLRVLKVHKCKYMAKSIILQLFLGMQTFASRMCSNLEESAGQDLCTLGVGGVWHGINQ
jgi:hypothetical protein